MISNKTIWFLIRDCLLEYAGKEYVTVRFLRCAAKIQSTETCQQLSRPDSLVAVSRRNLYTEDPHAAPCAYVPAGFYSESEIP